MLTRIDTTKTGQASEPGTPTALRVSDLKVELKKRDLVCARCIA